MSAQSEHACVHGGHYSACTLLFKSLKFDANFHHQGASDPKVRGTIASGLLRPLIWHLAKSNQTYGYGGINCQENSGMGGRGAAVSGVQYDYKIPFFAWYHIYIQS